jgi:hypothetical protein
MQVVAYSYSPVLSDDKIATMEEGLLNPSYLELKPPPASSSSVSSSETLQIDENFVLKGQTFLCMASFYYQPKANVIDFIEDLGLAGIRFVYFSSSKERESKGNTQTRKKDDR